MTRIEKIIELLNKECSENGLREFSAALAALGGDRMLLEELLANLDDYTPPE